MAGDPFEDAYVPEAIPESDLEYFERAGFGTRVGWGDSPAIAVVDLTNQFSDDAWPLGRSDTGDAAVDSNARLLDVARNHDVPVVYVRGLERGDRFGGTDSGRVSKSTGQFDPGEGNRIRQEVSPREGEPVLRKPRRNAFYGTRLDSLLREHDVDTLLVTGMVTSGCVRATVVAAFERDYRVVVPIECVADRGRTSHEVTLFDLDMKFADVTPLDQVIETIRGRSA